MPIVATLAPRNAAHRRASLAQLLCSSVVLASACAAPAFVAGQATRTTPPAVDTLDHEEGTWAGKDGVTLFEQSWHPRPTVTPRAVLIVVHGLKDHSDHYAALATELVRHGYAVYAFDLRGHGASEGRRVWVDHFDDYVDDLESFVGRVAAKEPERAIFVFGHSMGGAIVTRYAMTRKLPEQVHGIVLSGPALKVTSDVGGATIGTTKFLAMLSPRLAVFDLPNKDFSRDPAVVAAMGKDPLIYQGKGPAHTAAELLRTIDDIQKNMEQITLPLLALHGTADKLTNPEGSRELVKRAASTDKTLKLYRGYYHDLLHEPLHAVVLVDIIHWLNAHTMGTDDASLPSDPAAPSDDLPPPSDAPPGL